MGDGRVGDGMTGPAIDLARLGRELLAPSVLREALVRQAESVAFPGLRGVLPGFGLSLGYTLFYMSLVVAIPMAAEPRLRGE